MSGDDEIDIPDTWRLAVHPRRGGMAALESPDVERESMADLIAKLAARFHSVAAWLAQRGEQPFSQAAREVFPGEDPSIYWQRTAEAARLFGLVRRGWQWGSTGHAAVRHQLFRPFGPEGRVVLTRSIRACRR